MDLHQYRNEGLDKSNRGCSWGWREPKTNSRRETWWISVMSPRYTVVGAIVLLHNLPLLSFPQKKRSTRILKECQKSFSTNVYEEFESEKHKGWQWWKWSSDTQALHLGRKCLSSTWAYCQQKAFICQSLGLPQQQRVSSPKDILGRVCPKTKESKGIKIWPF